MEKSNQEKRKADPKLVKAFIKKNKKARPSTYSFEIADPSVVTPLKKMKDVTLTQMGQVEVKEPPHQKQDHWQKQKVCCRKHRHDKWPSFRSLQVQ